MAIYLDWNTHPVITPPEPQMGMIFDDRGVAHPLPPAFPGKYPKPFLARGPHPFDQGHRPRVGCVMELVSILDERRVWTDRPRWTTTGKLGNVIIGVNDALDDVTRQDMLHFVPRLVGATMMDGKIRNMISDYHKHIYALRTPGTPGPCPCCGSLHELPGPVSTQQPREMLRLTEEMLDHYDAMTGRPKRTLTDHDLTQIGMALAA